MRYSTSLNQFCAALCVQDTSSRQSEATTALFPHESRSLHISVGNRLFARSPKRVYLS